MDDEWGSLLGLFLIVLRRLPKGLMIGMARIIKAFGCSYLEP